MTARCQKSVTRQEIPDDVARVIQGQQPDLSRAALEALALEGYRSERLSEGQVRRMLGFRTRMQVHGFLKAHDVYLHYPIGELENDLASLKQFEETSQNRAMAKPMIVVADTSRLNYLVLLGHVLSPASGR